MYICDIMRRIIIVLAAVLALAGCSKGDLYLGGSGYVKVDGVKKMSLKYAYGSNRKQGTRDFWYIFEDKQEVGALNYEKSNVFMNHVVDEEGVERPGAVTVHGVPGCEDIYLSGIERDEEGYYYKKLAHFIKEGEEPEYITYRVKIDKFKFDRHYSFGTLQTNLKADITITSDALDYAVRIVYTGPTTDDGMEYTYD